MALADDNWYLLTFKAFSNVAWTGITPPDAFPTLPGAFSAGVIAGSTLNCYCLSTDGTDAMLIVYGIGPVRIPNAVVDTETLQTKLNQSIVGGATWTMVRGSDGSLRWYDDSLGEIRVITTPGALATFAT